MVAFSPSLCGRGLGRGNANVARPLPNPLPQGRERISQGQGQGRTVSDLTAEQTTLAPRPGSRIHPRFIELGSLALIAPLCVVGAIIGVQLIVTLGITANT